MVHFQTGIRQRCIPPHFPRWNSGQLNHGWGVTLAGSYKRGNGWVDETWTKGWFVYARIDKKLGNHLHQPVGHGGTTATWTAFL